MRRETKMKILAVLIILFMILSGFIVIFYK